MTMHDGHSITVTPIGPAHQLECSCGLSRRFASRPAANHEGLVHHHAVSGCNCPPEVVEHWTHPAFEGVAA